MIYSSCQIVYIPRTIYMMILEWRGMSTVYMKTKVITSIRTHSSVSSLFLEALYASVCFFIPTPDTGLSKSRLLIDWNNYIYYIIIIILYSDLMSRLELSIF